MSSNGYIINPLTQRPVKIGSRLHLKLMKQNIIQSQNEIVDKNILFELTGDETESDIQDKIREINKILPLDEQCVRGRGMYKNMLVRRNKSPNMESTIKKTISVTKDEIINRLQNGENFQQSIEDLILREMMKPTPPKIIKTTKKKQNVFIVDDPPEIIPQSESESESECHSSEEDEGDFSE